MQNIRTGEEQYLELADRILTEGVWVENSRTGKKCLTVINADFVYDASNDKLPLLTTRKAYKNVAINEKVGYLMAFDNASQFRELGCKTWDGNANETIGWLNNPFRKGTDDLGRVYGVQGRDFKRAPTEEEYALFELYASKGDIEGARRLIQLIKSDSVDQLEKVYNNLKNGIDDRGEIITYYNPAEIKYGCLRPCMHTHTFSILNDTLYLTSYQRSIDVPLGLVANMPQTVFFLRLMAQITGLKAGLVFHKMINLHIYEDQVELMKLQLSRKPYDEPSLIIDDSFKTLDDLNKFDARIHTKLLNYESHPKIDYPFSV